ncbi:LysR family transcriptional regulator [Rhodovibrionaceae bacterium A322]
MEMSQIKYALAAAKTLNFTKAATECNVSQPALTKAIKTLEADLGTPLFHREGRRILLSEFGQTMIPHLQQIYDETQVARTLADNFRLLKQVPVRLGILSTVGHLRLSRFLAKFQDEFEGVEVAVTEASVEDLKTALDKGDIDLAVTNALDGLTDSYNVHDLYKERYVVVFPPDHKLSALSAIKLSDLSREPYVDRLACELREIVMEVCQQRDIELYARFRSEREDWVQAMVLARIGFAFMPEYSITQPGLLQRPLTDPEVSRTISLVSVPGRPFSPAVMAMVRSAKSFSWPG